MRYFLSRACRPDLSRLTGKPAGLVTARESFRLRLPTDNRGTGGRCNVEGALRRRVVGMAMGALSIVVAVFVSVETASARAAPALTVPTSTERGLTAALAVSPRGARTCELVARGPRRRAQRRRVPGGRSYSAYLSISHDAGGGSWALRLRCDGRRSTLGRLQVLVRDGDKRPAGGVLFVAVRVGPVASGPLTGFSESPDAALDRAPVDLAADLHRGDRGVKRGQSPGRSSSWGVRTSNARACGSWAMRSASRGPTRPRRSRPLR